MTAPLEAPPLPAAAELSGGDWTSVAGTRVGVTAGDIKGNGVPRDDVVVLDAPGIAAAVTTTSTAAAAPCRWTRARVPGQIRAIVVNAGNANAATGPQGEADTADTARAAAELFDCPPDAVLVCSTGVIGVPLPMNRLLPAVRGAVSGLSVGGGARAARAILTTDLVEKTIAVEIDGVRVGGMAKGSGMIHPGMATMLAFLSTDAAVAPSVLQALLAEVTERTFNAISVDGDMSTNDTVILQATGQGRSAEPGSPALASLEVALEAACTHLAKAIAADGEGATTLIEAVVLGPPDAVGRAAARAIIRSPLVKSAVHGRDPNWGRIVGALGAAGIPDLDRLDLDLAGVPVLRAGRPLPFDEAAASAALEASVVTIIARLPGSGHGRAWGCDLSADYVRINADYRS